MFAKEKSMKYGGNNDVIGKSCPRCGQSCDRHGIQFIESNSETEKLAREMQRLLDETSKTAEKKGYELPRGTCMVGSAIALINSAVYKFVTISGANVEILNHIGSLGSNVKIIALASALPLTTIQGETLNPALINPEFPVGSCAAQKLLKEVFQRAGKGKGHTITKLNMSEILWTATREHNRRWSTGSVVCSCDTCKQVLPMMLCDQEI
jgi:hypothetical protein